MWLIKVALRCRAIFLSIIKQSDIRKEEIQKFTLILQQKYANMKITWKFCWGTELNINN